MDEFNNNFLINALVGFISMLMNLWRAEKPRGVYVALATLGEKVRTLRGSGLGEGVSTRLLVYAGQLIERGLSPRRACT